jgi:hypothetical protein
MQLCVPESEQNDSTLGCSFADNLDILKRHPIAHCTILNLSHHPTVRDSKQRDTVYSNDTQALLHEATEYQIKSSNEQTKLTFDVFDDSSFSSTLTQGPDFSSQVETCGPESQSVESHTVAKAENLVDNLPAIAILVSGSATIDSSDSWSDINQEEASLLNEEAIMYPTPSQCPRCAYQSYNADDVEVHIEQNHKNVLSSRGRYRIKGKFARKEAPSVEKSTGRVSKNMASSKYCNDLRKRNPVRFSQKKDKPESDVDSEKKTISLGRGRPGRKKGSGTRFSTAYDSPR